MIADGEVSVNGEVETRRGATIRQAIASKPSAKSSRWPPR